MANIVLLTSGGLAFYRDTIAALAGAAPAPPAYIVVGSGAAPVGRFWTQVPGEGFRAPIVARDASGNAITFHGYLGTADANGVAVQLYGLVGGAASAAAGSGTLIGVANEGAPFWKDPAKTHSIDLVITMSGVVT